MFARSKPFNGMGMINTTPQTHIQTKTAKAELLFFLGRIKCSPKICRILYFLKNRQILPLNFRDFFEVEKLWKSSAIVQFLKIFLEE